MLFGERAILRKEVLGFFEQDAAFVMNGLTIRHDMSDFKGVGS